MATAQTDVDVLIVGAGISGIGMAAHMEMSASDQSYVIVERRENLGGTWDLFRYPGIRSDSDMQTLGFSFEPWTHEKSIADAPSILEYLNRIVDERDIRPKIRLGEKVVTANFHRNEGCWHAIVENAEGEQRVIKAGFLFLGSGYYDYDDPYDAGFDFSAFQGQVLHPQFWPDDLDYSGKKIVVVGSGATAVTIVPAMAQDAAHITMLQRTPTYMFARPARDKFANFLRKILPGKIAYSITRWKNIQMQNLTFKTARNKPEKVKQALKRGIDSHLGTGNYNEADFTPPYDPWDQRLCLVPDADLFVAVKSKRASITTGNIAGFEDNGVRLVSGEFLEADIIVTATGLKLAVAGKIDIKVDGHTVDFADRFYYMSCMFSNVPNLAGVFGYLNASWTLRSDLVSEYICRVLQHMKASGLAVAEPVLTKDAEARLEEDDIFDFSSGYIQRSKHIMPRNATDYPWRLSQDYISDRKIMHTAALEDRCLQFSNPAQSAGANDAQHLEAAE